MSSIAEKVKISQDKDSMLRRALERIIQLYTDRSHFVYELLQNAEDAGAKRIKFVQYAEYLEVLHDGKPFTAVNLQGLCDIGKSDKIADLNQIGEFGVGFKSVFGICDTVKLYSEPNNYRGENIENAVPFAVEILDFTNPVDITEIELEAEYTTKFVFPYTVGRTFSGFKTMEELNTTLSRKLQNLGITTLLFMKNLEVIEYQIRLNESIIEGRYYLEKQLLNDHSALVSAKGFSNSETKLISKNDKRKELSKTISYLMFSRSVDENSTRTVDIAFPIVVQDDGKYECQVQGHPYISVYFPTETESKLGFIVQGPYRTTPNRSSVPADDEDNIRLAKETAILLHDSLIELKATAQLNISFLKVLPLSEKSFENYNLFYPLYETVKKLLAETPMLPCRNGGYVSAKHAKIARQEKLISLFHDASLSQLINDGCEYHWLPTVLTESNREYKAVYDFLTSELKVIVLRPEDLRTYYISNPDFLLNQSDDWLVELYTMYENIPGVFSRTKNELNMLTANIIKTSEGKFVPPYRRTEGKQYIPNVFLPSNKKIAGAIHYVDDNLYQKCRHFFDDILQLQKPNEYEFFVTDIKKRSQGVYIFDENQHIDDVFHLAKYIENPEYAAEIRRIVSDTFVFKCKDGGRRNIYTSRIYIPMTGDGVNIELYFKNVEKNVYFVDLDFYLAHGVTEKMLCQLGIQNSILYNDNIDRGQYHTGKTGRTPEWWTPGDFRWKLTLESIKEVVGYISKHPNAKDSIIKSKTIVSLLFANESKLQGEVRISGHTIPNLENEPCELVKILRGDFTRDWDGKWLYTDNLELVSPKMISRHDLNKDIYGGVQKDSDVYDLLGFRKTASDEAYDIAKELSQKQIDTLVENELKRRFGVSLAELSAQYMNPNNSATAHDEYDEIISDVFPRMHIKNWDSLKKHAEEMLYFAEPVSSEYVIRKIRVSNKPKEKRAYLMHMYRYENMHKYACQMCHDTCSDFNATQIFNENKVELDPMHLCLCPNCAATYQKLRLNNVTMDAFKERILHLTEAEITAADYVAIEIGNKELWFTQTHIAEVKELLLLSEKMVIKAEKMQQEMAKTDAEKKVSEQIKVPTSNVKHKQTDYKNYVGKYLKRSDGFAGKILKVDEQFIYAKIVKGKRVGEKIQIQIAFVESHPTVYTFHDKL